MTRLETSVCPTWNASPDNRAKDLCVETEELCRANAALRACLKETQLASLRSQQENETLLAEKSNVIRALHQRIHDLPKTGSKQTGTVQEAALVEQRGQLDEDRRRVKEDEDSLLGQMRDMEVSISRERADLSRRRGELERLLAELQRNREMTTRDPDLHARLASLRHPQRGADAPPSEHTPLPAKADSSLFRRLFGH
jgi:hypothetical protein